MGRLGTFDPPGMLVDVNGMQVHLHSYGERPYAAPVVICDSGLSGSSLDWVRVLPALRTQSIAYDRPGHGWSDPPNSKREPQRLVAELRTALDRAGIEPPYVMVGHSMGAMNMRLFAEAYHDDVTGLVLLDPAHIEMFARLPDLVRRLERSSRRMRRVFALVARLGGGALLANLTPETVNLLPDEAPQQIRAMHKRAAFWSTVVAERQMAARHYVRRPAAVSDDLGELPLTVVSAGASFDTGAIPASEGLMPSTSVEEISETWRELQAETAQLSTQSTHITLEGANHLTMLYDEYFSAQVAGAINALVAAVQV